MDSNADVKLARRDLDVYRSALLWARADEDRAELFYRQSKQAYQLAVAEANRLQQAYDEQLLILADMESTKPE